MNFCSYCQMSLPWVPKTYGNLRTGLVSACRTELKFHSPSSSTYGMPSRPHLHAPPSAGTKSFHGRSAMAATCSCRGNQRNSPRVYQTDPHAGFHGIHCSFASSSQIEHASSFSQDSAVDDTQRTQQHGVIQSTETSSYCDQSETRRSTLSWSGKPRSPAACPPRQALPCAPQTDLCARPHGKTYSLDG